MDIFCKIRNMKILLVDDDKWIRESMSLLFEAEGCDLLTLETAEEGLRAIKKQQFDIAIVDYRLPGMDGLTFLKSLSAHQPDVLRILITAYGDKELLADADEMGVEEHIAKPFTSEIIEASLNRLVEKFYEDTTNHINQRRSENV